MGREKRVTPLQSPVCKVSILELITNPETSTNKKVAPDDVSLSGMHMSRQHFSAGTVTYSDSHEPDHEIKFIMKLWPVCGSHSDVHEKATGTNIPQTLVLFVVVCESL